MVKSPAMSHPGRFRSRAAAGLIAILLAAPLASAGGAQPQAQASSLEGVGGWSTPHSEAFALSVQQRDNTRDVLLKALLTVGGAAAAAFLGLVGYVIRRRLGFWLHRPQTPEDRAVDEHH